MNSAEIRAKLTKEQLENISKNRQMALEKKKLAQEKKNLVQLEESKKKESSNKRRKRALQYCEVNFSKIIDSKGGFFLEKDVEEDSEFNRFEEKKKKKERKLVMDPPLSIIASQNPKCIKCKSIDLDPLILKHFSVLVCKDCKQKYPEEFSLLTKTEVKEDYLLTDGELRDTDLFKVWEKPNPLKSSYSNMLLYIRCQVENYVIKKWGSLEGLDKEFERREIEKKQRKEKKYKIQLLELRKKTRTSIWNKNGSNKTNANRTKSGVCIHQYGEESFDEDTQLTSKICDLCGYCLSFEEF
ncbi:hypothetical protein HK099_004809 [Clydaea vesicula]|uniref:XPA C-terminal domain-containing protein n=1 Tax=Clydaea vesicula TaxID=447962 RepID=A0AAD5Y007_9FUNG|nr:hypothetical protein HK099_004809 [Clydaea vesicula]KAJ3383127.1 hypothetical protein HDU92_004380 [Lobulomyces angularis]